MEILYKFEGILLAYFVISLSWSYIQMFIAGELLKKQYSDQINSAETVHTPEERNWPSISVLIPAYNEAEIIISSVSNLIYGAYPGSLDVCICDDGSTDETLLVLVQLFKLVEESQGSGIYSNPSLGVSVISNSKNGGRAAALNSALTLATGQYCIATDADTILDLRGIRKIIVEMERDKKLQVCGGTLLLANELFNPKYGDCHANVPRRWLAGVQAVEYLRAFLYGRLGLNKLGGNHTISGAFGVFRTRYIMKLGGWNVESVAEDFDMTTRIHMAGGKVLFIPDPVAWTQAPADLKSLGHQRSRWHRGLTEVFFRGPAKKALFKFGWFGRLVLPMTFIVEWLAPILEGIGLCLLAAHIVTFGMSWMAAIVLSGGYLFNIILSLLALNFEHDNFNRYTGSYWLFVRHALLEPFWYKPLTIYWRLRGLHEYINGKKGWGGTIMRKSFATISLLIMLATPAQAGNWVEVLHNSETGQVQQRDDLFVTLHAKNLTIQGINREASGDSDQQYGIDYYQQLNSRFGLLIGTHIGNSGTLFPWGGIYVGPSVIVGNFVLSTEYRHQTLAMNTILELYTGNIDFYINKYRFASRFMTDKTKDIQSTAFYVQRYGEAVELTLYTSHGNELLDLPLMLGDNSVVGGIAKLHITKRFDIILGLNFGERNEKTYDTVAAGLKTNF